MTESPNDYKIDKDIPIPNWRQGVRGKWAAMAKEMEVGDSVLVKGRIEAMNMRNAIIRQGFGCVTRGNDKPETRVWKVAKR